VGFGGGAVVVFGELCAHALVVEAVVEPVFEVVVVLSELVFLEIVGHDQLVGSRLVVAKSLYLFVVLFE
jgi:hypothetical protein